MAQKRESETGRRWLPKAPPYKAPTTRSQWSGWLGMLLICFLAAVFTGRRGSDSLISHWQARDDYARRTAEPQAPYISPGYAILTEMRDYWFNRISPYKGPTIWWRPQYEGFIQRVAKRARELELPLHAVPADEIDRIASECCAIYCARPTDEPALVPPPDMSVARMESGAPEGCAAP